MLAARSPQQQIGAMMRRAPILASTLLATVLLAACGSSSSSKTSTAATSPAASTSASAATQTGLVRTASNPVHGTILVNSQGMTLYALSGETGSHFICTSTQCVAIWHPLKASGLGTPSGSVASLSTVKRPDGTVEVTYKGMPLYTFTQDTKAGETNGQGIKDVGTWSVVTVSSTGSAAAGGTATTPSSEGSSGGSSSSGESKESSKSSGGYAY
jgi:predicted lipoprotein with Yx(FWY)xxD motif